MEILHLWHDLVRREWLAQEAATQIFNFQNEYQGVEEQEGKQPFIPVLSLNQFNIFSFKNPYTH